MKTKKLYDVAVNDVIGNVRGEDGKQHQWYVAWAGILRRCYDQKFKLRNPTYNDCVICEEWKIASNFKAWYDVHGVKGWSLDKDILIDGNKVYGPDTCLYVPQWLNVFVINREASGHLLGATMDKDTGKYRPRVEGRCLGSHSCPLAANRAYLIAKLEVIERRKPEFDAVDSRIYPVLVERYKLEK